MTISQSRGLCEAMAGKLKGYRSVSTLKLYTSASGVDYVEDSGSKLVTSGFAIGDLVEIHGASAAANDVRGFCTDIIAGQMNLTSGLLTEDQVAAGSLVLMSVKRGSWHDLFYNSQLDIYSGSRPTNADETEGTGTKLVSFTGVKLGYQHWDDTNDKAYFNLYTGLSVTATVLATGTASWFRWRGGGVTTLGADTTGAYIRMDGSIGVGTGDLQAGAVSLTAGDPASISNIRIYFPQ
jgi:hypothetical protein